MALGQTLIISAAAICALTAATYLLPRHITVERSATIGATPSDILTLAASNSGYQAFNPYKTADPDLKIEHFGPERGVGSGFAFDGKDGKGTQVVADITDSRVTYAIDLGAMGKPTQKITATPGANGTHVVWSVEADMGLNPIARVIGLFMDGMMGKTLDQGLINLEQAV